MVFKAIPAEQRFWSHVNKLSDQGCWEWTANTVNGYGRFQPVKGTNEFAHRYSYRLHRGPIPEGMNVCHGCNNRQCVNPAHLFLGTPQTNQDHRRWSGRAPVGERNGRAVLTEDDVRAIRADTRPHVVVAREYGIAPENISACRRRITWKHVA